MSMFHELMMKKKGMPSNYELVDYIQADGTQYIKTGYIPNTNTEFIVDCSFDNLSAGRFGRIVASSGLGTRFYFGVSSNYFIGANGDSYNHTIMSADTNEHLFKLDKNGLYIDNELKYSHSGSVAVNSADLYLFATHDLVTGTGDDKVNYYAQCKVRYCTIKENGGVKRNFIPVYDTETQKYGMWESVERKFYGNDGTGNFKGSIVGYTIVGSPTIVDGVVSGFSSANYLTLPTINITEGTPFNIITKISTPADYQGNWLLAFVTSSSRIYCLSQAPVFRYLSNGTATNLSFNYTMVFNTTYILEVKYDGNKLKVIIYDENKNILSSNEVEDTKVVFFNGSYTIGSNRSNQFFNGSIDMNETDIKINNKLWFNGQQA